MKLSIKCLLFFLLSFSGKEASAQWTELVNHPFVDTLWSVHADGNRMLVTGKEGVLYSSNSGTNFNEITTFDTPVDSAIYERSKFYTCAVNGNYLWIAGEDTVNHVGVVFYSNNNNYWWCPYQSSLTEKFVDCEIQANDIYFIGENAYAIFGASFALVQAQGYIHPWSNESYTSIADANSGHVMALSQNFITKLNDNGVVSHESHSSNFQTIGISNSSPPVSFFTTRDNTLFYGEDPNYDWEHFNAISDVDTFTNLARHYGTLISSHDGVYHKSSSKSYAEKMIGSEGYYLNDVFTLGGPPVSPIYAVGANGKIIKSTNVFGPTFPFVGFDYMISYCKDSVYVIDNLGDNSYSYEWYLDNVLVGSTYDLTYTFANTGFHQLKLVGSNGTYSDSLSKGFYVILPPSSNMTHSLSDTIICHEGIVDFTFDTEAGIQYGLIRQGETVPDSVFTGTGGSMTVSTDLITDTTFFLLHAGYPSQTCSVIHELDTIFVQHPKAQFYVDLINADQDETINLYDQSQFSDSLIWLNLPIQVNVSAGHTQTNFSVPGGKDIGAVAITNFGCSDTLFKSNVVYVVDTFEYTDVCYDLLFKQDTYDSYQFDLDKDSNGNFYVATNTNTIIPSTIGNEIDTLYVDGYFIAKYNKFGVLKWLIKCKLSDQQVYNSQAKDIDLLSGDRIQFRALHLLSHGAIIETVDGKVFDFSDVSQYGWGAALDHLNIIFGTDGTIQKYLNTRITSLNHVGVDSDNNFYLSQDEFNNTTSYLYWSPDTTYVGLGASPLGNPGLVKLGDNGPVWALEQDFIPGIGYAAGWMGQMHQLRMTDAIIYLEGHSFGANFTDSLYSTDGSAYPNGWYGTYNSQYFLAGYDTAGVHQWHCFVGNIDHNTKILKDVDVNGNLYMTVSGVNTGDSIWLHNPNVAPTPEMYGSRLISCDKNGDVRFDYQFEGIGEFGLGAYDLEAEGNHVLLSLNANSLTGDTIYINDSPTSVFAYPIDQTQDYTLYLDYDTSGVLLNYRVIEELSGGNLKRVQPEQLSIDALDQVTYSCQINMGANWQGVYYPPEMVGMSLDNGQNLVVSSLNENCADGALTLDSIGTMCHIDTVNLIANSNFTPYNVFLSNNEFILHSSTTDYFQNGNLGDTLTGTTLNNLEWNFDFSTQQPDTIWIRLESTHPHLFSNIVPVIFFPSEDSTYSLIACENDTINLIAENGLNFVWTESGGTVVGNTDTLVVVVAGSAETYSVDIVNGCGVSWTNDFVITPLLYNGLNTDSISLCPDVEVQVDYDNAYIYTMNGNTSTLGNNSFGFQFTNDTVIYYSLYNSFGCSFNDSTQFIVYDVTIPTLTQQGPPWEIVTTQNYTDYVWTSSSFFNNGFGAHSIFPSEDGVFSVEVTDSNGCVTSNDYYFSLADVPSLELSSIFVHPVPTDDELFISGATDAFERLEIYTVEGRKVMDTEFTDQISTANLPTGVYYLILSDSISYYRYKIVKE